MRTLLRLIVVYLAVGVAFAAVDFVWLTRVGPGLYFPALDPVALRAPRMAPAVAFYLAYILGVVVLAVWPNRGRPLWRSTLTGALLGAMCYATYDLTNQATLKVWATKITLLDIGWGTFLTAVGATVGGFVLQRLKPRRFR